MRILGGPLTGLASGQIQSLCTLCVLTASFCLAPTLAQPRTQSRPELLESVQNISTTDELTEWMMYYYLHPRPDLVVSALRLMSQEGYLLQPSSSYPVTVFLSRVLIDAPGQIEVLLKVVAEVGEDQQFAVALALWLAGTEPSLAALESMSQAGSERLERYVAGLLSDTERPRLLEDKVASPATLDAFWSSFFATGDPRYVKRIIAVLPWTEVRGDPRRLAIGGAAQWSLTSNAIQHPRVLEICEAALVGMKAVEKGHLQEVVRAARERTQ